MKISQLEAREKYLFVKMEGPFSLQDALSLFDHVEVEAVRFQRPLILFDVREVTGEIRILARFQIAEDLAQRSFRRLAMVVRSDQLLPDRFMQTAARNRGLIAQPFTEFSEAETWLSSGTEN
jgi:hypothetical protein